MTYFIYEEEWGTHWYDDEVEWKKEVDGFDFNGKFCDEGWNECVENCLAGKAPDGFEFDDYDHLEPYALYVAKQFDRQEKPSDLDESGYSTATGEYWNPEWDYKCNYAFALKENPNLKRGLKND